MFRSQSPEKFRYDTTKGQPENTSVQSAQFQDPDACLLRLQASVSPQQHEPSCAVLQVPVALPSGISTLGTLPSTVVLLGRAGLD